MKKYNITVNGTTYEVVVEEVNGSSSHAPVYSSPVATAAPAATSSAPKTSSATTSGANTVVAPMPGTVLDIKVSVGQAVKKGEVICVLEAMKMENDIPAPCDGVIASVNVQKGATLAANDVIVSIN
ncbi:MAG: acetyl-CoA carboxylase biotin carboxyl carrier protein subunit [Clostridia bacterium]|nr:acetyl-CoA carboxylase biotin carboxyl carrier protein subunit [Clostridia bacterium]